jgi:hypothetical protein
LARYRLWSATRSSPSTSWACSGTVATPRDTVTATERPPTSTGASPDRRPAPLRHVGGGLAVGLGQQDDELLSAVARDHVAGPDAGEQPPGHLLEHRVADGVAEAVVDPLEVVGVQDDDRQRPPRAPATLHLQA